MSALGRFAIYPVEDSSGKYRHTTPIQWANLYKFIVTNSWENVNGAGDVRRLYNLDISLEVFGADISVYCITVRSIFGLKIW